ncbi:MAG: hypothetical protein ACE5HV_14665, partial [Acidobacteriota bacterium]
MSNHQHLCRGEAARKQWALSSGAPGKARRVAPPLLLAAAAGLLAGSSLAAEQQGSAPATLPLQPIALVHANVVDVHTGDVGRDITVVLRDGRIAEVGSATVPASVEVIDLDGAYLLPGLMDAHVHIDELSEARRALESGVTTVRSASVGSYRDVVLRQLVKRGYVAGPDLL